MNFIANDILMHYGVKRRSGRYPWGSGESPYQHSGDFLSRVEQLRKEGCTFVDEDGTVYTGDTAIAKTLGLSTTDFRAFVQIAKSERRAIEVDRVKALKEKGYSNSEIARQLGYNNESSIRALLNENAEANMVKSRQVAEFLKQQVDEKGIIDIGAGTELNDHLRVSATKWDEALSILAAEGYPIYGVNVPQATNPGQYTNTKVLCPPGTQYKDAYNLENIHSIEDYISDDDGGSFREGFLYPSSMNSKRLAINYAEDGGDLMDGVIEIRRGVKDLSLGDAHYAQVRILVDGNKFLKGMAVYSDDLPPGIDVRFNTKKNRGVPKEEVLKSITDDPDNPFGSTIKEHGGQSFYDDPNGKYINPETGKKQSLSLINKRAEEGDWMSWDDTLPSQFLAKQSRSLIKKQLTYTIDDKITEFNDIKSLTNPTVKRSLLQSFADDCDAGAVHLKAAALPRQSYKVILPVKNMKDNEIYAPTYKDGETVAVIRYPHGGTFEIPVLTVNNKHADAKRLLGNALDAVGINKKVANRLSGADFDGDTVMIIPCNSPGKPKITSTDPSRSPALKDLASFDTDKYAPDSGKPVKTSVKKGSNGKKSVSEYYSREGHIYKRLKGDAKQQEMGKISNLITDMTLKGASFEELSRAVKHSMVVIDAEKHNLDYKQSEIDNDIQSLKDKYQRHDNGKSGGASTLISMAKSPEYVDRKKGSPKINQKGKKWYDPDQPEGALIWNSSKKDTYVDSRTGQTKTRKQKSTKMAETRDAYSLVSEENTQAELLYADYANRLKSLANEARKEMVYTGRLKYSASANKTYQKEVDSLKSKLNISLKNAPREREAQRLAAIEIKAKKQSNSDMTDDEIKKLSQQALARARTKVGAKRNSIDITDIEWEAIQNGAVSDHLLEQILRYADIDKVRERATPRSDRGISDAKLALMATMSKNGYTIDEIAQRLGVSSSTISKELKKKGGA